jgi:uncharacterized membrane protein
MEGVILIAVLLVCVCIVLPIVAFVRTNRIHALERRLAGVEAALHRLIRQQEAIAAPAVEAPVAPTVEAPVIEAPAGKAPPAVAGPPLLAETPATAAPAPFAPAPPATESLEAVIGQKWVGWIAVLLIFCAAAFFLKYAFENRWIGELGRVTIGVAVGLAMAWGGLERHRKGWRYLAQILTGGGIVILYLSVYGAFGYYHLLGARSAFVALVILVAEAHLLALFYNARAVAVMALVGGFLVPVLLSTGRDQYAVLFTYMGILDLGVLAVVMVRRWPWIGSLAYVMTQGLFWLWYGEHYHPEKRAAVVAFQAAILLLFLLADLAPHLRRQAAGWEECIRLTVSPFVFYATCYFLLNDDHHEWMAPLALTMAILYAAMARAELALRPSDRRFLLITAGTALTFVTLAIPVQLESNWITIGWGVEALVLLWASFEAAAPRLQLLSGLVFTGAILRFLFVDTPWEYRASFTPVFNRYFLGMLALAACLAGAAYLARRMPVFLTAGLLAVGVLWLGLSFEAYSYFDGQARELKPDAYDAAKQLRWTGQLALSVLWSVFAGSLTAAGFRLHLRAARVAGLVLFGVTLVKVVFLDISELRQFYRILALLALGVVLLVVAWKYQRGLRREQPR